LGIVEIALDPVQVSVNPCAVSAFAVGDNLVRFKAQRLAPRQQAPLNGPSPEAKRYLIDLRIDYTNGSRGSRGSRESFVEHFRIGADGKIKETQYQLARGVQPCPIGVRFYSVALHRAAPQASPVGSKRAHVRLRALLVGTKPKYRSTCS
jgi:hypothetical protein